MGDETKEEKQESLLTTPNNFGGQSRREKSLSMNGCAVN